MAVIMGDMMRAAKLLIKLGLEPFLYLELVAYITSVCHYGECV